jgi:amidase
MCGRGAGVRLGADSDGDSGRFGGNMDFNEIVDGTTVYLPVAQTGPLFVSN